jgi:hypothetical protein
LAHPHVIDIHRHRERVVSPRGLSRTSARRFKELVAEYGIRDVGGLQVLHSGLISLDLAEAAEAVIARDGLTTIDRFHQTRAHPLIAAARDHRAAWLSALRQLNLSIGTPTAPGRPEGA